MSRLGPSVKSHLLSRIFQKYGTRISNRSIFISTNRLLAEESSSTKTIEPPPLKFSETAAYRQRRDRDQGARPTPTAKAPSFWEDLETKGRWFKLMNRVVFIGSTIVFMIYFLILREENDIDEELSKPLWQRLPSLEEQVLQERVILGKNKGEDVSQYEERLNQLHKERLREQERLLNKNQKGA